LRIYQKNLIPLMAASVAHRNFLTQAILNCCFSQTVKK
jgi:hypothetical protein